MIGEAKHHCLYVDETGSPNHGHHDPNYTLCGIIVRPYQAENIKTHADQIKFKYWNTTDVVFHSHEMGKKINKFDILKDSTIEKAFFDDLFEFLQKAEFRIIVVSVDKVKAKSLGLTSNQVQDIAADKMIECFTEFLSKGKFIGKIVMESSGGKDMAFYKRYSSSLSQGLKTLGLTHKNVKDLLTSISFVNKNNHDIETQLADIFAYPATRLFLHNEAKKSLINNTYEHSICEVLKKKLAKISKQETFYRLPI